MNCTIHKGASSLQEVTDTGATTTNTITANGFTGKAGTARDIFIASNSGTAAVLCTLSMATGGEGEIRAKDSGGSSKVILNGAVGQTTLGANAQEGTALLNLVSTTKGFLPPRMSTTQRDAITSPAEGLCIYNLTLHKLQVYNGSAWADYPG